MNEFDTTTMTEGNIPVSAVPKVHSDLSEKNNYVTVSELPYMPSCKVGLGNDNRGTLPDGAIEHKEDFYNASGCADPTAYQAIRNVDYEYRRFQDLLHTIWSVCKLAGFRVEGHITLVDKRTGRVWK